MNHRRRLRTLLFLANGLILTALVVVLYLLPSWDPVQESFESTADLERKSIDARFAIRGERKPPDDLVIVGIDAETFQDLQRRWPFPRAYHARVIDHLRRDGAKVIVYDVQFTEPSELGPEDDNALILACRAARNCVLSSTEANEKGETAVFGGPDGQEFAKAITGMGNFQDDPDGVTRKLRYEIQGAPTLAVAAYERLTRRKVDPGWLGGRNAYVDWTYPSGEIDLVPFSKLCRGCGRTSQGERKDVRQQPRGYFKDKIVVVGPIAPTLQDIHATPTDEVMPGAELQANAFQTVRDRFPIDDSPAWVDILLIVLMGAVAPLASIRLRLWGIGLAIVAGLAYALANQLAFNAGEIVSFTYPMGSLLLTSVGSLAVHYVTEAFERARTRDMFSRFVPESVVGDVLDQADGARLGGVGRYATVMFSDLRGFTSFAEQLEPDQVIRILNRYLTAMVDDAILPHGGTLVDYMGDGIMAVFGAPIEMGDHADRALAASRAKLEELERFNDWVQAEYGFEKRFQMGIGLNTGNVMSGNVGSEQRLAYTAIGDTTNTAARLEGMTKGTDFMIFLSDATREALGTEPPDLAEVGEYEIRGRVEKLKIWTVEGSRKDDDAAFASVAKTETLKDK